MYFSSMQVHQMFTGVAKLQKEHKNTIKVHTIDLMHYFPSPSLIIKVIY